jgi:cyclase
MYRPRVIPCLLLKGEGLVKTVRFGRPKYVGDPINAVKIFNEKEVDELIFLDIMATRENRDPSFDRIRDIAGECFMPVCYGGGVRTIGQARKLFEMGVEKVSLNTAAAEIPALVTELAGEVGSQSVIVAIDVRRDWLNRPRVVVRSGEKGTGRLAEEYAREMVERGAGEIFLNSVDRDGTMKGFDLDLIGEVAAAVSVPVVACGGAGSVSDLAGAIAAGASAVAAGSLFVFTGPHRAVLINYPKEADLPA